MVYRYKFYEGYFGQIGKFFFTLDEAASEEGKL